jgi:hypothetical protein
VTELSTTYRLGPTLAASTLFPLLALGVIWLVLPETSRRELEDTARL